MKKNIILIGITLAALLLAVLSIWLMPERRADMLCLAMCVCIICNAISGINKN